MKVLLGVLFTDREIHWATSRFSCSGKDNSSHMYLVHWFIVGEGTSGGFLQSHVWNIVTGGGVGGFMETPPITDSWGVELEFKAIGREFLLLGGHIEVAQAVILKPGNPTTWSKSRNLRSPVPPSRWSWQGRPLKGEVFAAADIMLFRICGALEDRCNRILFLEN